MNQPTVRDLTSLCARTKIPVSNPSTYIFCFAYYLLLNHKVATFPINVNVPRKPNEHDNQIDLFHTSAHWGAKTSAYNERWFWLSILGTA